ncbi:MAG: type I methionyl aminopeptidase [Bacillota bacterium]|nr:type I methionyl aminopeptidase [Bacillota bacterium]
MIIIKSAEEIELMRQAAVPTKEMLNNLADIIKPGMSTKDIDDYVEEYILKAGMKPAFKGYSGYPACACVSLNEEVVHGIPSKKRILMEGDIVSVDLGTIYKGFYSDAARTYPVGKVSEKHAQLIKAAEDGFNAGLFFARKGNRLGDISHAIQEEVESQGFSVIRDYVGHGVGREMHEDPMVPNYGKAGHGVQLVPGMVIAVEPMIATGDYAVRVLPDGWTAVTKDGGYAAHYENTIVITDGDPILLTK